MKKAISLLALGLLCCLEVPAQSASPGESLTNLIPVHAWVKVGRCSSSTNFVDRSVLRDLERTQGVNCIIFEKESVIQDTNIMGVEHEFKCYLLGNFIPMSCDDNNYLWANLLYNPGLSSTEGGEI